MQKVGGGRGGKIVLKKLVWRGGRKEAAGEGKSKWERRNKKESELQGLERE